MPQYSQRPPARDSSRRAISLLEIIEAFDPAGGGLGPAPTQAFRSARPAFPARPVPPGLKLHSYCGPSAPGGADRLWRVGARKPPLPPFRAELGQPHSWPIPPLLASHTLPAIQLASAIIPT